MTINLLGVYQNGNYKVSLFENGTKIRENDLSFFDPEFPECMDVKITNYCDKNCPFCHEDSNASGSHGDILQAEFVNTLRPFTELAIGGGNPLSHPDLLEFLRLLKSKNIVANLTINQTHWERNKTYVQMLIYEKLIYGLGVSLVSVNNNIFELSQCDNVVLHVINGVVDPEELKKLYKKNFKILILGYKNFRRGNDYYSERVAVNKQKMYDALPELVNNFDVVSFDNLAISQLEVSRLLSAEKWNEFYMGDDGQYTMYIDLVKNEFARSSTSIQRFPLLNNIDDMFGIVRNL